MNAQTATGNGFDSHGGTYLSFLQVNTRFHYAVRLLYSMYVKIRFVSTATEHPFARPSQLQSTIPVESTSTYNFHRSLQKSQPKLGGAYCPTKKLINYSSFLEPLAVIWFWQVDSHLAMASPLKPTTNSLTWSSRPTPLSPQCTHIDISFQTQPQCLPSALTFIAPLIIIWFCLFYHHIAPIQTLEPSIKHTTSSSRHTPLSSLLTHVDISF